MVPENHSQPNCESLDINTSGAIQMPNKLAVILSKNKIRHFRKLKGKANKVYSIEFIKGEIDSYSWRINNILFSFFIRRNSLIVTLSDLFKEASLVGLQSGECLIGVTHTPGQSDYRLLFFHIALVNNVAANSLHSVDRRRIGKGKSANIFRASYDFDSIQNMISNLKEGTLRLPFAKVGHEVVFHGLDTSNSKPISYLAPDSRQDAALTFLPFPGQGLTIFELFDLTKNALEEVSADDIMAIDQMLLKYSDFSISSESARIGNLILVASLDPFEIDFRGEGESGNGIRIKLTPLRSGLNFQDFVLTASTDFNGENTSTAAISPIQNVIQLKQFDARGLIDLRLWDIKAQKLVGRNFGHIINDIGIHIGIASHSREGFIRGDEGEKIHHETITVLTPMGTGNSKRTMRWTDQVREQIQLAEKKSLVSQKKLIHFNDGSHLNALLEIVSAINSVKISEEVKIWDPYIGKYYLDFLTLVKSTTKIKVVSALDEARSKDGSLSGFKRIGNAAELLILDYENKLPNYLKFISSWIKDRRNNRRTKIEYRRDTQLKQYLEELRGLGFNIEFRYRKGSHVLSFHDRFIMAGGKCWAVGSSLNSIGSSHSIMIEVPYPEIIEREFDNIWNELKENQF